MKELSLIIDRLLSEELARGLSNNTYASLQLNLKRFKLWCIPRLKTLEDMNPQFLSSCILESCAEYGSGQKKAFIWSVRKLGDFLLFHNYLSSNPAQSLKYPKRNPREKLPNYLNEEEMRMLFAYCAKSGNVLLFTLVSIFLNTGLRPSDLEDIRIFQYFPEHGYFTGIAKGGVNRATPLSDALIIQLNRYLESREFDSEYLLLNSKGRPLKRAVMLRMVRESAKKAGIEKLVTPRMLRHTFATHFTDRHGSIMCKALLGHGSHRNTQIYSHLSPSRFRKLMNIHPYNKEFYRYGRPTITR